MQDRTRTVDEMICEFPGASFVEEAC